MDFKFECRLVLVKEKKTLENLSGKMLSTFKSGTNNKNEKTSIHYILIENIKESVNIEDKTFRFIVNILLWPSVN